MSLDNLKKAIKEDKLIIGTERTLKSLKKGIVKEVFVSKNCPEDLKNQIKKYVEISGIKISELEETNLEIGTLCKKPFSVNLCCY
jgi:large subunit ribosomal protein L30e